MNEEMKTFEEIEETEVNEVYDEPIESGDGILGKVLLGVGLLAAGGTAAWVLTKNKREQHQIKKLEKKGYLISKPEEVDEESDSEESDKNAK